MGDGTVVVAPVVAVVVDAPVVAVVCVGVTKEEEDDPPEDADTPMQTAYPTARYWQLDPTAGFQLAEHPSLATSQEEAGAGAGKGVKGGLVSKQNKTKKGGGSAYL